MKKYWRKAPKKSYYISIFILAILISITTMAALKKYEHPSLVGKWKSIETGQIIYFTDNGKVKLRTTHQTGHYQIESPSKMVYTLQDKTFNMYYTLEDRQLAWGITPNKMEHFVRK